MRPVNKLSPGQYGSITITKDYPKYQDAKTALVFNLGSYCSYCEESYHQERDLHVEHVQPKNYVHKKRKKIYAHLETKWSNFLLSCATCNGTDNKGAKNVILTKCHLPHRNNTFKSLVYMAGGVVMVNPLLVGNAIVHADNLLNLVGLNKGPKNSCPGDTRWKNRRKIWDLAVRYLNKGADVDTIIDLAKGYGGWSIWFTVFKGHDEVRKALIEKFPGTAARCFDANNHYEPIDRNPGHIDPT